MYGEEAAASSQVDEVDELQLGKHTQDTQDRSPDMRPHS
jgi:hypothetical protein